MYEQKYANGPMTALAAAVTDPGAGTVSVTSAAGFPSAGDFTIKVESELMLVTGVSGTTFTVLRGQENTLATTHPAGAMVTMPLTAYALQALVSVYQGGTFKTHRRRLNLVDSASVTWAVTDDPLNDKVDLTATAAGGGGGGSAWEAALTVPALTDYTWVNQGTATAADDGTGVFLRAPAAAQNNFRALVRSVSAPWTFTAKLIPFLFDAGNPDCGILVRSSASGEVLLLRVINGTIDGQFFHSPTSYDTEAFHAVTVDRATPLTWFRVSDDGSNRTWWVSVDGLNWTQVLTNAHTFGLTADQVGFFVEGPASGFDAGAKLVSAKLT
jgi:hypothetical protein